MKKVHLIHNPGAGEKKFDKDQLLKFLLKKGFDCRYFSTKEKGWKKFDSKADLVIAGGDGTIRKVAGEVLKRRLLDKTTPFAVLPLGTANNIAKTLKLKGQPHKIIRSWNHVQSYDVGRVFKLPGHKFFLESLGYGIFPDLMKKMEKYKEHDFKTSKAKMNKALREMHRVIRGAKPLKCELKVDGKDHSGEYLLVEVMNTPSIGPNLHISPGSDIADGQFEVLVIGKDHKKDLEAYITSLLKGRRGKAVFETVKGKKIQISCEGMGHIDDELIDTGKPKKIVIEAKKKLLNFLVPRY